MKVDELFFTFLEGRSNGFENIVAPIYGVNFCWSWLNRSDIPVLLSPPVVENLIKCGQSAGVIPIICMGWWDLNPFGWKYENQKISDKVIRRKWVIRTPCGEFAQILDDHAGQGAALVEMPVKTHDDFVLFDYLVDLLKENEDKIFEQMVSYVKQVRSRAVLYLNVPLPHLAMGFIADELLIYSLFDVPDKIQRVIDRCDEIMHLLVDIGLKAGVRLFFNTSHCILGPSVLEDYMVPYAVRLREKLTDRNAFVYMHECGKMSAGVDSDMYNRISPHILEGLEPPPLGDIDDLAQSRKKLNDSIIFKGNINLTSLQEGGHERIRRDCREILTKVAGYRHILGTACSILYGTTMENVRILSEFQPAPIAEAISGIEVKEQ